MLKAFKPIPGGSISLAVTGTAPYTTLIIPTNIITNLEYVVRLHNEGTEDIYLSGSTQVTPETPDGTFSNDIKIPVGCFGFEMTVSTRNFSFGCKAGKSSKIRMEIGEDKRIA